MSKGRLIYGGAGDYDIYRNERIILQAASKELKLLKKEVVCVLELSKLKKVAATIMAYWGYDMPRVIFRALQRNLEL